MERVPLPSGFVITMANGGKYTIKDKIGEGGFSLVYSAETEGGKTPLVIKEFYPARGAFRGSDGKVQPTAGDEERFNTNFTRFTNEGTAGEAITKASFQAISFLEYHDGYAVMKCESTDMRSVSALEHIWESSAPLPFTGIEADRDRVFGDIVRVRYALRITESLLSALETLHSNGYLHLDISATNVIWAGSDISIGENCEAFLTDFGCAVKTENGTYRPEDRLSYSPGFAAPEVQNTGDILTPATDLYSVGMLLFFLCVGNYALMATCNRKRQIVRETEYLAIPERIRSKLNEILTIGTADDMANRYQNTAQMLQDVRGLRNMIPLHPINPDNSKAFTLYSLKSMLEGSRGSHYSWVHELCDRRGKSIPTHDERIYDGVSWKEFQSDRDFLCSVLPEAIYNYLIDKVNSQPDRQAAISAILSCNYDSSWKTEICRMIKSSCTHRLLILSRSLLNDETAYSVHKSVLFDLLEGDEVRLSDCYYKCKDVERNTYMGLALFILFALLGPDGFQTLFPSPSDAYNLFKPLGCYSN